MYIYTYIFKGHTYIFNNETQRHIRLIYTYIQISVYLYQLLCPILQIVFEHKSCLQKTPDVE